jgi:hypothetical protein
MRQDKGYERNSQIMNSFKRLELSLDSLTIYKDIAQDNTVRNFKNLLHSLALPEINMEEIFLQYFAFYNSLKENNWQDYLVELILCSSNSFAHKAANTNSEEIDSALILRVKRDIEIIQEASKVSSEEIVKFIQNNMVQNSLNNQYEIFSNAIDPKNWPVWENTVKYELKNNSQDAIAIQWLSKEKATLKKEFREQKEWSNIFA